MAELNDVKISGVAKVNGGRYRNVEISGLGEISGDLEAEELCVHGVGDVKGGAKVKTLIVKGTCSINGDFECRSFKNSGLLDVYGRIKAEEIYSGGKFTAEKGIKAEKILSKGYMKSGEGVESEDFISKGSFNIAGLLNSNKVDVIFGGHCYAKEIGGEEISVRHSGIIDFSFILGIFGKKDRLESELIEGNSISLEYSDVKTVRGGRIKIGEKCSIEHIEYSESLEIHPDSIVKNQIKVK